MPPAIGTSAAPSGGPLFFDSFDATLPFQRAVSLMRVLFDTNVLIDGAVPERSYHEEALGLLSYADQGRISGLVAPISFATCWYVATTHHDVDPRPLFETVETIFEIAPMNRAALRGALHAGSEADFEDAYLVRAGAEAGADVVLTRNEQDFKEGPLTPHRPETLLRMLQQ